MKDNYKVIKINNLPHSEVEIEAEITADYINSLWAEAVKHLGEHVKLDGFRSGHIPENVLISKVGEMAIVQEAADLALSNIYPYLIVDNKIHAIGRPEVIITKMAKGTAVSFKLKTSVVPEIKIPDYKKIASKVMGEKEEPAEATDKELEDLIQEIRKSRAPHVHKEGEEHKDDEVLELPEFNDVFVKSLGDFTDVADFREKAKKGIAQEKAYRGKEKKRMETLNQIAEKTNVDLPLVLVESELEKMKVQFEESLARMNLKMEDYLTNLKKTVDDVKKEWRPEAEKRTKIELVINKIAEEEKIEVPNEEIEREVKHTLEHYKDANPAKVKIYIETVLTNEKVLQFLESQK
jgi:FKBP-type peptidyl-prolyl cis-trans isomerase (trigger factor)